MTSNNKTEQHDSVQIDTILQDIRQQIVDVQGGQSRTRINIDFSDNHKSASFREAIYQAWLLHNEMDIQMMVQPSSVPIIGRLITAVRIFVHRMVIFYAKQVLDQQKAINEQLIIAISELDSMPAPKDPTL